MKNLQEKDIKFILHLFRNGNYTCNGADMARLLGITPMGSLKVFRRLEKEQIVSSRMYGRARYYKLNLEDDFVRKLVAFLLRNEAESAPPGIKVWIKELKKIRSANLALIFGSVLIKQSKAGDVDVLFVTDQQRFENLKKEINMLN
ncbi:MAG: winged helix-turn-helix domain-containing protein, partial [Candidatus Woesearchaeota archaeon]